MTDDEQRDEWAPDWEQVARDGVALSIQDEYTVELGPLFQEWLEDVRDKETDREDLEENTEAFIHRVHEFADLVRSYATNDLQLDVVVEWERRP